MVLVIEDVIILKGRALGGRGDIVAEDCRIKLDLHFGKLGRLCSTLLSASSLCEAKWGIKLACFHLCDWLPLVRAQPPEELGAVTGAQCHIPSI